MKMKRFVIIAHGRTGSKLLSTALDIHAECMAFGELFNEDIYERKAACLGRISYFTGAIDADTYLSREVYTPCEGINATGFTLFYEHARGSDAERAVWHYLLDDTDVVIIHLQRRRLLEAWLSYELARYTGQWALPADAISPPTTKKQFIIDALELERFFDRIHAQRSWVDKAFAGHSVQQLFYEDDLCNRFTSALNQLYRLLGLYEEDDGVEPILQKQNTRPPLQLIKNYYELADHFSIGPYACYFEKN